MHIFIYIYVHIFILYIYTGIYRHISEADLYSKPSDCHQFLEFNSAHPIHIKKPIVYSQGLRIKRLCSSSLAFEKHLEIYVLGLGSVVTQRNLLSTNLEG